MGFEAFNVGTNDWTLTIGELAECVSSIMGVSYEITNANGADKRSYRVSFDKFESQAKGFLPCAGLQQSVQEMSEHLSVNLSNYVGFREGYLMRLNVLRAKLKSSELDESLRAQGSVYFD